MQAWTNPFQGHVQPAIVWPDKYAPGETDNFVSNERIVKGITANQIWRLLADITKWETYYANCSQIEPPESGPILQKGDTFKFSTFGFPVLPCLVHEAVPPEGRREGRIAWSAALSGGPDEAVDVYHAWLIQELEGGRVRILPHPREPARSAGGGTVDSEAKQDASWSSRLARWTGCCCAWGGVAFEKHQSRDNGLGEGADNGNLLFRAYCTNHKHSTVLPRSVPTNSLKWRGSKSKHQSCQTLVATSCLP